MSGLHATPHQSWSPSHSLLLSFVMRSILTLCSAKVVYHACTVLKRSSFARHKRRSQKLGPCLWVERRLFMNPVLFVYLPRIYLNRCVWLCHKTKSVCISAISSRPSWSPMISLPALSTSKPSHLSFRDLRASTMP